MNALFRRILPLALALVVALPALASAVEPLFDLSSPAGGPFPSDHFTALDLRNNTLLRVNLPKPDCTLSVRLSGPRRHQHTGRLQHPAAPVDPVLRPHRPHHGEQQHGVPGAAR
jgi:hypothetical protein